ncbi:MAG: DNA-binding transcriptional regulator [Verrucomicrobiae bacterium]
MKTILPIKAPLRVALLIETSNGYGRGLLKGISHYIREHERWQVYLCDQDWGASPDFALRRWKGDGIIARIETPAIATALRGVKIPTVDVSSSRLMPKIPWFENDYPAIAKLAMEHFTARGFKRFAFCGDKRYQWAQWIRDHFTSMVRAAGYPCYVIEPNCHSALGNESELQEITAWVKSLPKPIALLACNDFAGRGVLEACRIASIQVPDEIAVLGQDNDEVFCELSTPPLSSIQQNSARIGYEAAAGLVGLMRGETLSNEGIFVPPIGIVTRQSTDVLAIEDRSVVQAVRFIREHACEGINVKDVLKAIPQSRRLLESKFRKVLGHTPHDEILNIQLAKVKLLLVETDHSMESIAERTGFNYVEYLSVAFKRIFGMPPSEYRKLNRR